MFIRPPCLRYVERHKHKHVKHVSSLPIRWCIYACQLYRTAVGGMGRLPSEAGHRRQACSQISFLFSAYTTSACARRRPIGPANRRHVFGTALKTVGTCSTTQDHARFRRSSLIYLAQGIVGRVNAYYAYNAAIDAAADAAEAEAEKEELEALSLAARAAGNDVNDEFVDGTTVCFP